MPRRAALYLSRCCHFCFRCCIHHCIDTSTTVSIISAPPLIPKITVFPSLHPCIYPCVTTSVSILALPQPLQCFQCYISVAISDTTIYDPLPTPLLLPHCSTVSISLCLHSHLNPHATDPVNTLSPPLPPPSSLCPRLHPLFPCRTMPLSMLPHISITTSIPTSLPLSPSSLC